MQLLAVIELFPTRTLGAFCVALGVACVAVAVGCILSEQMQRWASGLMAKFLALSSLNKAVLVIALAVSTVCAQKGTNRPPAMIARPTPQNEVAQVWQPVGGSVVRAEALHRCGATEDALRLAFGGGFVFPDGSNHLDRVVILSSGEVRRTLQDRDSLVRFGERLWSRPYDSELTAEHTPSNSYRLVWRNFYANGDTNLPRTASAELFRNGYLAVTENGVTTIGPYVIPFPHDGFGQDDDWVRANCTNAAEVLSVGYADWVDDQVGVDLENGLYKFTATFPDDPPEATRLFVGDKSVCVTSAGEYVFLLEKGVEYGFGTVPFDDSVEYSMQDDVVPSAPVFAAWWWGGDAHGEWSVDGGWHWIDVPSVWGFGACLWMPKFHGAPDVQHLGVDAFPMTFTAVWADWCRTNGAAYRWTSSTEGVNIVSPNAQTTEVTVDSFPSWDYFSLTVEADLAGETLTSTLRTTYGRNQRPQVSLELSVPDVMFANDDDDDDDGVADSSHVTPADNDIARGVLTFRSDVATNATLRIESISGFDTGFVEDVEDFVFLDSDCTQPVREGSEFEVTNGRSKVVPLYVNPVACSSGFEDVEITASMTLEGGERREATARATVISPVVEPICNETKSVEAGGVTNVLTYNPCGVGIGERAYFKIRVTPDEFPDSKIVWKAEGGLAFVGGNTGREVCVQGITAGRAALKIRMRESELDMPMFSVIVVPVTTIGIHAMIVRNDDETSIEHGEVAKMIKTTNDIYAQVCMRFYLASIVVTNLPDAFYITRTNTTGVVWSHDRLTAVMSNVDGVECYFVKGIYDTDGYADTIRGLTSDSGIVISSCAVGNTLAHEIGHLCGARDVYMSSPDGGLNVRNDKASMTNMMYDWNGGCNGRGAAGTRYYVYGLGMENVIGRLLMYGESTENDKRRDLSAGDVRGVWYSFVGDEKVYEQSDAPIGMARGMGFAVPRCQ